MTDEWAFVYSWMDDIINPECLQTLSPTPVSVGHRDDIARVAPASPPLSSQSEKLTCIFRSTAKSSPLKRKRCIHSNSSNCDNMSPRKRTRTQDDQLSMTTATSVLTDMQLAPTAHSRSSYPTKVRANSPVRELREIYRFATPPLKYTTSADQNTPQSVLDMISGLPLHGVGVIPGSLQVQ